MRGVSRKVSSSAIYIDDFVRPVQPSGKYDWKSAVEYARKYALKANPDYIDFETFQGDSDIQPNDCTNFTSQVLIAGKALSYEEAKEKNPLRILKYQWLRPGQKLLDKKFTVANLLSNYLEQSNKVKTLSVEGLSSQEKLAMVQSLLEPGDVIAYEEDSDLETDHLNVLIGYDHGIPVAANHTTKKIYTLSIETIGKIKNLFHIVG